MKLAVALAFIAFSLTAALASAALISLPAAAESYSRTIKAKLVCTSKGCKKVPSDIWTRINYDPSTGRGIYQRCDARSCSTYPAQIHRSGIYQIVDVPGRGTLAKLMDPEDAKVMREGNLLGPDDDMYIDLATLGVAVYLSFGSCVSGS